MKLVEKLAREYTAGAQGLINPVVISISQEAFATGFRKALELAAKELDHFEMDYEPMGNLVREIADQEVE